VNRFDPGKPDGFLGQAGSGFETHDGFTDVSLLGPDFPGNFP
jgi:hypothetical protein